MKILKHGICHNEENRKFLVGRCQICHCEFETFVDIVKEKDRIIYITDVDCMDMKMEPTWMDGDWSISGSMLSTTARALCSMMFSLPCPECGRNVELKMKT